MDVVGWGAGGLRLSRCAFVQRAPTPPLPAPVRTPPNPSRGAEPASVRPAVSRQTRPRIPSLSEHRGSSKEREIGCLRWECSGWRSCVSHRDSLRRSCATTVAVFKEPVPLTFTPFPRHQVREKARDPARHVGSAATVGFGIDGVPERGIDSPLAAATNLLRTSRSSSVHHFRSNAPRPSTRAARSTQSSVVPLRMTRGIPQRVMTRGIESTS